MSGGTDNCSCSSSSWSSASFWALASCSSGSHLCNTSSGGRKQGASSSPRPLEWPSTNAHALLSSGTPLRSASASVRRTQLPTASTTSKASPAPAVPTTGAVPLPPCSGKPKRAILGLKSTKNHRGRQGRRSAPRPRARPSTSTQASSPWTAPLLTASLSVSFTQPSLTSSASRTSPVLAVATPVDSTWGMLRKMTRGLKTTWNQRRPPSGAGLCGRGNTPASSSMTTSVSARPCTVLKLCDMSSSTS
mmetsp:Transcript_35627/g.111180  ORF Transcript_35627/g.111180 Transcript_35627/m.111180 type:complete len:248 (-) Transcript_35627:12-755(-)